MIYGIRTAFTVVIFIFVVNIFIPQSFSFLYSSNFRTHSLFLTFYHFTLLPSCMRLVYNMSPINHSSDRLLWNHVVHQNKCFTTPYLFTLYRHSYRLYKRCGKIRRRKKRQTILLKLSSAIPGSCLNITYPYEFALTGSC